MKNHKSATENGRVTQMNPSSMTTSNPSSRKGVSASAVSSVKASVRLSFEIEGHKVSDSQWQAIKAMADSVKIAYA